MPTSLNSSIHELHQMLSKVQLELMQIKECYKSLFKYFFTEHSTIVYIYPLKKWVSQISQYQYFIQRNYKNDFQKIDISHVFTIEKWIQIKYIYSKSELYHQKAYQINWYYETYFMHHIFFIFNWVKMKIFKKKR